MEDECVMLWKLVSPMWKPDIRSRLCGSFTNQKMVSSSGLGATVRQCRAITCHGCLCYPIVVAHPPPVPTQLVPVCVQLSPAPGSSGISVAPDTHFSVLWDKVSCDQCIFYQLLLLSWWLWFRWYYWNAKLVNLFLVDLEDWYLYPLSALEDILILIHSRVVKV